MRAKQREGNPKGRQQMTNLTPEEREVVETLLIAIGAAATTFTGTQTGLRERVADILATFQDRLRATLDMDTLLAGIPLKQAD